MEIKVCCNFSAPHTWGEGSICEHISALFLLNWMRKQLHVEMLLYKRKRSLWCKNADVLNHFHKDLRKLRQSTKFWCLRQDIFLINLTDVSMKFPNWLLPYLNMNKMSCLNMEHKLSEQEMRDIKFQKKCCKISTLICILWYLFPFPWKKIDSQN